MTSFNEWPFCILWKHTFTQIYYRYPEGTMTEINQLRMTLQESSTARNVAEGQCISLEVE